MLSCWMLKTRVAPAERGGSRFMLSRRVVRRAPGQGGQVRVTAAGM